MGMLAGLRPWFAWFLYSTARSNLRELRNLSSKESKKGILFPAQVSRYWPAEPILIRSHFPLADIPKSVSQRHQFIREIRAIRGLLLPLPDDPRLADHS
jgi:hypothetical protein